MPGTVTLVDPEGHAREVPSEQAAFALANGFSVETGEQRNARAASDVRSDLYGGVGGGLVAGGLAGLRGATLGISDAVIGGLGGGDDLAKYRDENPTISTVGNMAGALAPALLTGGASAAEEGLSGVRSLMAATPTARLARIGTSIAEAGEGAGLAGRVGATIGASALEGSAQGAGGYISDVALGDRKLSADGFVGAMGNGALWGGVAGGALKLTSEGLMAARRLFPASALTAEGLTAARGDAQRGIADSLTDGDTMVTKAEQKLADMRSIDEAANPALKQRLNGIRDSIEKIEQQEAIDSARGVTQKSGNALDWLKKNDVSNTAPAAEPTATPFAKSVAPEAAPARTLEEQLAATKAGLDGGENLKELSNAPRDAIPRDDGFSDAIRKAHGLDLEDALNTEYAKTSAPAAKLFEATQGAKKTSADMAGWLAEHGEKAVQIETESVVPKIGAPSATGDEIAASRHSVSSKIDAALADKSGAFADEVAETAPLITKHEAAHAELAEQLGADAPPTAAERASGFRDAQSTATGKATDQTATVADALSKSTQARGLLEHAKDAGAAYEALRMMGVPLPDPKNIPVVGPLLSLYLKAKVLGRAMGRSGRVGIMASAETTIASKGAAVRQRLYKAADAMLAGSAAATGRVAATSGGAVAALGHVLFSASGSKQSYSSTPDGGELGELFTKRAAEVAASQQPGAIDAAVRAKVQTSDPEVLQEIIATKTRQLQFLNDHMPRPDEAASPLSPRTWMPAKSDAVGWARLVAATEDPAGVFERAAKGLASSDEIDAVKTVYPAMYADAQQHVLNRLVSKSAPELTGPQRAAISRTWGLPLDGSPDRAAFLQLGYKPPAPAPAPSGPMPGGPINLGQRTLMPGDAR